MTHDQPTEPRDRRKTVTCPHCQAPLNVAVASTTSGVDCPGCARTIVFRCGWPIGTTPSLFLASNEEKWRRIR